MFLCAKLTKLQSTENVDTNPDPDPECISICHMRSKYQMKLMSCSL